MIKSLDVFISGFEKSGTTSLLQYLSGHPEIDTHRRLEFCYFMSDFEHEKSYEEVMKIYFNEISHKAKILLAKNAKNIYSSSAIERLYKHNPLVKQIIIMRNPIDRAYSAYWHERRRGMPVEINFDQAIAKNLIDYSRIKSNFAFSDPKNAGDYLNSGTYYLYLNRLFHTFDPKNIRVIKFEDLKRDPINVCQDIFDYIEVDSGYMPDTETVHNQASMARSELSAAVLHRFLTSKSPIKRKLRNFIPSSLAFQIRMILLNLNKKKFKKPPMNPETRTQLVNHFKPHNARLSDLLCMDFSDWNQ